MYTSNNLPYYANMVEKWESLDLNLQNMLIARFPTAYMYETKPLTLEELNTIPQDEVSNILTWISTYPDIISEQKEHPLAIHSEQELMPILVEHKTNWSDRKREILAHFKKSEEVELIDLTDD